MGEGVGFLERAVDEEGEKNGDLPGTQRSNRLSWQTNWELGKFLSSFLHEGR